MKNVKPIIFLKLLTLLSLTCSAQDKSDLTLKEAINFGLTHNTNVLKGRLEIEKNKYQFNEALSVYLPQVKASASVIDNLKLQTSILPGEVFGQPGQSVAVRFGTKYNTTTGIDVSQTLVDVSQMVSLKAAAENNNLARLNLEKAKEQLIYDIASAYYSAQITSIQQEIAENNLSKIDSLITITRVRLENGFAKKVDLDRLVINSTNAKTELENINLNYTNQVLFLKYTIAMPMETDLKLADDQYESNLNIQTESSFPNITTEIKLLESQNKLHAINLKRTQAGYLPTLTFGYKYAYQVQQNDFQLFGSNVNWFPNSYFSFNLNIPIFDGGSKANKARQIKVDIEQTRLDEQNLKQNLAYQSAKSTNKLLQNKALLTVQKNNIKLAEEVFADSQSQFKGGIGSMSDFINAETALKEAQINYLNALVQIKIAELDILKTNGNLNSLNK